MGTRDVDLQDLRNSYKTARSEKERTAIVHAASTVSKESKKVESMRESLIKARRSGNSAEVRDINNWVASHKEYQNDR